MNEFYIAVRHPNWIQWGKHTGICPLLCEQFGAYRVEFIRNNHPNGDLYKVKLKETDCLEFFILRTGHRPIDETKELKYGV